MSMDVCNIGDLFEVLWVQPFSFFATKLEVELIIKLKDENIIIVKDRCRSLCAFTSRIIEIKLPFPFLPRGSHLLVIFK